MTRHESALCIGIVSLILRGCGGGAGSSDTSSGSTVQNPAFTISLSPSSVTLVQGASQPVQVSVMAENGFTGSVSVTTSSVPGGVTVSPTTLSISSGSPAAFTFSASSTAGISRQSITLNATSDTLTATASLQLNISGNALPDPFHPVGGSMVHGFYDESRNLLFATNIGLNELDVISGQDFSIKARVPIPQPWGIDQMADGNTLRRHLIPPRYFSARKFSGLDRLILRASYRMPRLPLDTTNLRQGEFGMNASITRSQQLHHVNFYQGCGPSSLKTSAVGRTSHQK